MITSFSRLFRQIFGGPRTQPVTGAAARAVGADVEAQEAAAHRENLKRAMEAAFATPTAGPEEPFELATPLEEQVAAIEAAVTAEPEPERAPEITHEPAPEPSEQIEEPMAETEAAETAEAKADPLPAWHTVDIVEPPVEEIVPALDLAEVEDIEYDDEPAPIAATAEVETAEPAEELAPIAETEAEPVTEAPVEVTPVEDIADLQAVAEQPVETVEEVAEDTTTAEEPAEEIAAAAPKPTRSKKAAAKPRPKKKASPAKRKPAKKAASLEDGVWLSDAIVYSLSGEWTAAWSPPEDASAAERLELFREKAAAGEFVIWGCAEGTDAWQPIKPAYWKTALVEPLSFLMGRENVSTDPTGSKAKNPVKYTALKVVQPDIEALWPPATGTEATRDAA